MKFIAPESVAERQGDIGNPPLSERDLNIATVIANMLTNMPFSDEYTAALLAIDCVRFYDQPVNADKPVRLIEWYRNKAEDSAGKEKSS